MAEGVRGTEPFRQRALGRLVAAFGDPEVLRSEAGALYRWVLRRAHRMDMYITLDSPEMPDMAHLIVSDPKAGGAEPVASLTMRTIEEVDAVIGKLREQWERGKD